MLERIVETQISSSIKIDDMQFGFMPGRGTTDAIFIVRQLQEKFLAKNKICILRLLIWKRLLTGFLVRFFVGP